MPERIIRPGILTSERVCALSWGGEVFYRRLMSAVDDYGRYDGRETILRTSLYPLQIDKVSNPDIGKWKLETAKAGLVRLYSVGGKEYLELQNFKQRLRAAVSKWPAPDSDPPSDDSESPSSACGRMTMPTETETETETETDARAVKGAPTLDDALAWAEGFTRSNGQGIVFTPEMVEHWHDHRASKGWTIGEAETPIRDWKADLRNWARNEMNRSPRGSAQSLKPNHQPKPLTLR